MAKQSSPVMSRRALVGASLGAVAIGASAGAFAAQSLPKPSTPARQYEVAELLGSDLSWHGARRFSFGPTPQLRADIAALGLAGWIRRQAAIAPEQADPLAGALAALYPRLAQSPAASAADTKNGKKVVNDLVAATTARAVWSPNQLHEVMTMFWQDHFNVYLRDSKVAIYRADYDAIIRARALGRFADLLPAVITHPAMLLYLNANQSTKTKPNENLGRELLELHTLGIGSYGEDDVKASAQLLTGLTVKNNVQIFNPKTHVGGTIALLGRSYDNADGQASIAAYLNDLAHHPATARMVATKIATRFVSDAPSEALISQLAEVFLGNDTAIVPVLLALVESDEFLASVGQKSRSPFFDLTATLRALGTRMPTDLATMSELSLLATAVQQVPYDHAAPDGYPLTAEAWLTPSAMLGRMNMHHDVTTGAKLAAVAAPLTDLIGSPGTWAELVDTACEQLCGGRLAVEHRNALLELAGVTRGSAPDLALAQTTVIPAILSSPYFWSA